MLDELKLIEAVAPDILAVLQERFKILQNIYWMQPIGRRNLAESMEMTERILRSETDQLKKLQLIEVSKSGMTLTEKGEAAYNGLGKMMDQLFGMHRLEKRLADHFGIARCVISTGAIVSEKSSKSSVIISMRLWISCYRKAITLLPQWGGQPWLSLQNA